MTHSVETQLIPIPCCCKAKMIKAESAAVHEKAEVVMLRREGKSDVITLVVESDIP